MAIRSGFPCWEGTIDEKACCVVAYGRFCVSRAGAGHPASAVAKTELRSRDGRRVDDMPLRYDFRRRVGGFDHPAFFIAMITAPTI